MSRIATNWVWKMNLKASQKLLLLALADRADEHHCCYPSIQKLSNDTGERKGATKQVKVLRLNITEEEYQKRYSESISRT